MTVIVTMISIDYNITTYEYVVPYKGIYWFHIKLTVDRNLYWNVKDQHNWEIEELRDLIESRASGRIFAERGPYDGAILFMFENRSDFLLTRLML